MRVHLSKNRAEILELRDEINAGVTGLWATEKINRMAMLQHIVEAAQDHLDALEDAAEEAGVLVNYKEWCRYSDLQVKILHEIAEQMGQIPARAPAGLPAQPRYLATIEGVDMSKALGLAQAQPAVCSRCSSVIDVEDVEDGTVVLADRDHSRVDGTVADRLRTAARRYVSGTGPLAGSATFAPEAPGTRPTLRSAISTYAAVRHVLGPNCLDLC